MIDVICPNCERVTDIRHCQACGCDFVPSPKSAPAYYEVFEYMNRKVADEMEAFRHVPTKTALEFDRARETSRRKSAVELLLSLGYVWRNGKWEMGNKDY